MADNPIPERWRKFQTRTMAELDPFLATCIRQMAEQIGRAEAALESAMQMIETLLASAVPNAKEHPTMTEAWHRAEAFVEQQRISRETLQKNGAL